MFKVKVNFFISALANVFISAKAKVKITPARFWLRRGKHVDFDFKILTAFIRLGRARPVGAGCPPYIIIIII
jgi:hypothetical protein